jgi:hypothetical protein
MKNDIPKPENPLAFPNTDCQTFSHDGMTLRDYFAAKAMQSLILQKVEVADGYIAQGAYQIADAMLQERSKP